MPIPFALLHEPAPAPGRPPRSVRPQAALRGSRMFPSSALASLAAVAAYGALALILPVLVPAPRPIVVENLFRDPHDPLPAPRIERPAAPRRRVPPPRPAAPEPVRPDQTTDPGVFVPSADAPDEPLPPAGSVLDPPAGPAAPGAVEESTGGGAPHDAVEYWEEAPEVIREVKPVYTQLAIDAGVSGTVTLRVLVGIDGRVEDVKVLQSIPLLDGAAIEAAWRWRFRPARVSGRPVRVWVALPMRFRLH